MIDIHSRQEFCSSSHNPKSYLVNRSHTHLYMYLGEIIDDTPSNTLEVVEMIKNILGWIGQSTSPTGTGYSESKPQVLKDWKLKVSNYVSPEIPTH